MQHFYLMYTYCIHFFYSGNLFVCADRSIFSYWIKNIKQNLLTLANLYSPNTDSVCLEGAGVVLLLKIRQKCFSKMQ